MSILLIAAPTSEHAACRACGTWICSECSARRPYASRFASIPQRCATCSSANGHMAQVVHRESRADDHDASYRRGMAWRGAAAVSVALPGRGCLRARSCA
jgi:hypothetical protein